MSANRTGYADQYKNQGYWRVGDVIYPTKIQAILAAQKSDSWPTFHYNDEYWSNFDWSQEPAETLEELYLARAKQLREKYKTLILRYSGGGDSYNILKTFLDNGIKLDVVVVNDYCETAGLDPLTETGSQEKIKVAYPVLETLKQQGHDFRIMKVDLSRYYMLPLTNDNWWMDLNLPRLRGIEMAAPRMVQHPDLAEYDHPSTGVIIGLDKPIVRLEHGKIWTLSVSDFLPCMLPTPEMSHMVGEPFYWTADMPKLLCKQAHVFKNYLKQHSKDDTINGSNLQTKSNKALAYALLYSKSHNMKVGDPLPYWQDPVSTKMVTSGAYNPASDGWIIDSAAGVAWQQGIEAADNAISSVYKNGSMMIEGLKAIFTKKYWLGS
jgi:hypothetical protein